MTRNDVTKLFGLMRSLFARAEKLNGEYVEAAWYLALKPYSYEDIKSALLAHARKFNFPPDIAELTAGFGTAEPETARWDITPEDAKNNIRTYAAIIEEPFPDEIKTPEAAYAWFRKKRAERRSQDADRG